MKVFETLDELWCEFDESEINNYNEKIKDI